MSQDKEQLPRGFRRPPTISADYFGRQSLEQETLYPMWDSVSGVNPFGPPEYVKKMFRDMAAGGEFFKSITENSPIDENSLAVRSLGKRFGLENSNAHVILSGEGSAGILEKTLGLFSPPGDSYLVPLGLTFPFIMQEALARRDTRRSSKQILIADVPAPLEATNEELMDIAIKRIRKLRDLPRIYYMCNPNTPKGDIASLQSVARFAGILEEHGFLLIVDEAFGGWINDNESAMTLVKDFSNLIVTRSDVSKLLALPGARLGYAGMSKEIGAAFKKRQEHNPFRISGPSQLAMDHIFDPNQFDMQGFMRNTHEKTAEMKSAQIAAILQGGLVRILNRNELRSPFFTAVGPNEYFYEEALKHGLKGAPGSGFRVEITKEEPVRSLVREFEDEPDKDAAGETSIRFTTLGDLSKVNEFARRLNLAAESALAREEHGLRRHGI